MVRFGVSGGVEMPLVLIRVSSALEPMLALRRLRRTESGRSSLVVSVVGDGRVWRCEDILGSYRRGVQNNPFNREHNATTFEVKQ